MPEPLLIQLPGIPPHRLLYVPGGEFLMGSPDDDPDARDNEKPAHRVKLGAFYLGEFQVTQDLWQAVTGENPSDFKSDRQPVEKVTWDDINDHFLPRLRDITGDKSWRLPTEAEWEYAARGGPYWESEGYRFAGSDLLKQTGWYTENSGDETQEVGLLLPNALGLYDMSGNVWEWCADPYDENHYRQFRDKTDVGGKGPGKGNGAVLRGGSWGNNDFNCRVARRNWYDHYVRDNDIGFRLARAADEGGR